jgi:V/A-type H+/Na+-transporting ATPase subunit F
VIKIAELAVIGDNDFVMGFELIGIKRVFKASGSAEDLKKAFAAALADRSIGILVADEASMSKLDPTYRKTVENSVSPVIVTLSAGDSSQTNLRDMIKKAIGIDLMAK